MLWEEWNVGVPLGLNGRTPPLRVLDKEPSKMWRHTSLRRRYNDRKKLYLIIEQWRTYGKQFALEKLRNLRLECSPPTWTTLVKQKLSDKKT